MRDVYWILTCEHASRRIPRKFLDRFQDRKILETHFGYDIGAYYIGKRFQKRLDAPYFFGTSSRLLVELNRSLDASDLFSKYMQNSSESMKQEIVNEFYIPFRKKVYEAIVQQLKSPRSIVVHISIHTFTKVYEGASRLTEIGVLFDPRRKYEALLSQNIIEALNREIECSCQVRANEPYLGISDGHVTHLRKEFPENRYVGIELEFVNCLYTDRSKRRILYNQWIPTITDCLKNYCFQR